MLNADDYSKYKMLSQKQMLQGDLVATLEEINNQLANDLHSGRAWGEVAVVSLAVLVPLNAILNAFEMKAPASMFEMFVKKAYEKFGKSGAHTEGNAKKALDAAQGIAVSFLKVKSKEMIPVVNILFGLAQDSVAFYQAASNLQLADSEGKEYASNIQSQIFRAKNEILKSGIKMNVLLERTTLKSHTA